MNDHAADLLIRRAPQGRCPGTAISHLRQNTSAVFPALWTNHKGGYVGDKIVLLTVLIHTGSDALHPHIWMGWSEG